VDAVKSLLSTLGATLIEPKAPSLGQRGDRVDDHIVSHKNDYAALVLRSIAVAESTKNQLLRDVRRRSIFRLLQHYPADSRHRYTDRSGPFRADFVAEIGIPTARNGWCIFEAIQYHPLDCAGALRSTLLTLATLT
jgi:hypothetical protein